MELDFERVKKYHRWATKKTQGKPKEVQMLFRRTLNTANIIVSTLHEMPFVDLVHSLFLFCRDVKAEDFVRRYESQLELAGANEERFVRGLHVFYNDMASQIKKNDLYQTFFEFLSACLRARQEAIAHSNEIDIIVTDCYVSLVMQQTEYLRPKKYDFSVVLCGQTMDGELMTTPDLFPNFDIPAMELETSVMTGAVQIERQEQLQLLVRDVYRRHGYQDIQSVFDVERVNNKDRLFTNHRSAMFPYINEYTFDMLTDAEHAFTGVPDPLLLLRTSAELRLGALQERLRRRARTLPSNGVLFTFSSGILAAKPVITGLKLKELFYDDVVIMLYLLDTCEGQLCGYYNTQDGFFYTIFGEGADIGLRDSIRLFVLYLYATQVLRDGTELLNQMGDCFWYQPPGANTSVCRISAKAYGRGGKPTDTYRVQEVRLPTRRRVGNEDYISERRFIQGFVRKLGPGRSPSQEAVERGKAMGYDLAPDETYVQPFVKNVLKLRVKRPGEEVREA